MVKLPSLELINKCSKTTWDLANLQLYNLCKSNFYHENHQAVLGKIWLIGRSYSVAIERRRNKTEANDTFYNERVVPSFINSQLDKYLNQLKKEKDISINNISLILEAHKYLTKLTYKITGLNKRSFASKYLHFHLPNLFFIYDSRAVESMRQFAPRINKDQFISINLECVDKAYAQFFYKALMLQENIENTYNINIAPRWLDNILLEN